MIQISDLQFRYPSSPFRLEIPHWEVQQESQVAIVGPSGSGKTTLLHLIAGILQAEKGSIRLDQTDISSLSDGGRRDFRAANIGLIFQRFELVEYLNVRQNILLPLSINRSLRVDKSIKSRMEELAKSVGIGSLLQRRVQNLSQGERQRVAICRALVTSPKWIFADEPTGNLDPKNKVKIVQLLKDQCKKSGSSLLMVTHDTSVLQGFDQVVDFDQWRHCKEEDSESDDVSAPVTTREMGDK